MILKTLKLVNSDENGGKAIFRVFRVLTWTNSEIQGFQGHLLSFQDFQGFQGFQGPVDTLLMYDAVFLYFHCCLRFFDISNTAYFKAHSKAC